jgi:hypothetical protein
MIIAPTIESNVIVKTTINVAMMRKMAICHKGVVDWSISVSMSIPSWFSQETIDDEMLL